MVEDAGEPEVYLVDGEPVTLGWAGGKGAF